MCAQGCLLTSPCAVHLRALGKAADSASRPEFLGLCEDVSDESRESLISPPRAPAVLGRRLEGVGEILAELCDGCRVGKSEVSGDSGPGGRVLVVVDSKQ